MFDLLIRGGRVIDGAGNPWYAADVGIEGHRIVAVGRLAGIAAARTIDADGLFVCPGFTDMHTHSDLQLLVNPAHEAKVHQGVTLEVLGQDGLSYAPLPAARPDLPPPPGLQLVVNPRPEGKGPPGGTVEVLGQDGPSYGPLTDDVLDQLRGQLAGWNDDPPGFDWSWRTVAEYLDRLDADGIAVN